jgi:hypothetical protein
MKEVRKAHPTLAEHLKASLKFGVICEYRPPDGFPTWTVITEPPSPSTDA